MADNMEREQTGGSKASSVVWQRACAQGGKRMAESRWHSLS